MADRHKQMLSIPVTSQAREDPVAVSVLDGSKAFPTMLLAQQAGHHTPQFSLALKRISPQEPVSIQ